ncbi:MAG: hypothetical protein KAR06_02990 [Deltaproteobacteria bacterium]|nr:hypothetical protein [Deltaproteobacteria bacterium]
MAQAILNGQLVDDGGATCDVRFEWGSTIAYGMATAWQGGFVSGDNFNATIYGLAEGSAFHFRAVSKNSRGFFYGNDMTFSTLSSVGPMGLISDELLHQLEAR